MPQTPRSGFVQSRLNYHSVGNHEIFAASVDEVICWSPTDPDAKHCHVYSGYETGVSRLDRTIVSFVPENRMLLAGRPPGKPPEA